MIEILIAGAGIVGSWIALELSRRGKQVAVCDSTANGADGISGRNSGVLHAGIYYPKDSRKARHCIEGRELTIAFAKRQGLPYRICGKAIVAGACPSKHEQETALQKLHELQERGLANGVEGLEIRSDISKDFSYLHAGPALYSPQTGVVDAAALLRAVQREAERQGAIFLWNRSLLDAEIRSTGQIAVLQSGHADSGEWERVETGSIINAAGLHSDTIAGILGLSGYEIRPNRGEYFRLKRSFPDSILVYPVPGDASGALGVHYTFHLNGDAYAGPNSRWAAHESDYRIEASREEFYQSLCRITDFYTETDLSPGYSGLRPRLFSNGKPVRDFVIEKDPNGNIHLLGIESPGLTSAPSLAREVAVLL